MEGFLNYKMQQVGLCLSYLYQPETAPREKGSGVWAAGLGLQERLLPRAATRKSRVTPKMALNFIYLLMTKSKIKLLKMFLELMKETYDPYIKKDKTRAAGTVKLLS